MINRGYGNDAITLFISKLERATVTDRKEMIERIHSVSEVLIEDKSLNVLSTTWKECTPFQAIFNPANEERYWIYTGGRGSGKSFEIGEDIVKMTFEQDTGILFARYMAKSVKTSIAPSFLAAAKRLGLEKHFYITEDKIINRSTGSFIYMGGIHSAGGSTSGLKSLEGVNVVVIDEAEDLDSEKAWTEFNKLDDSIRSLVKVNRICLVLNPKSRTGQVYKNFIANSSRVESFSGYDVEISTRSDVRHIHCTFHKIRKYLDKGWLYKEEVARTKAEEGKDLETGRELGEEEWNIAKEFYANNYIGVFNDFIAGRIFPYFEVRDEFPNFLPIMYGLDFGFTHVDAMVRAAIDFKTKTIYVEKLIFEAGLSQGMLNTKIMESTPRHVRIYCDSADPRRINDLRRSTGRALTGVKKKNPASQIAIMLDFTIVVCGDSEEIENELNQYRWGDKLDVNGKPVPNKNDDVDNSIDALRYAITEAIKDYSVIGKAVSKPDPQPLVAPKLNTADIKRARFKEAMRLKKLSR